MTTKKKRELIIEYLRQARHEDLLTGYNYPYQFGTRSSYIIADKCFRKDPDDHRPINSISVTKICNQLVKEGILERVMPECSYKYYRIREEI